MSLVDLLLEHFHNLVSLEDNSEVLRKEMEALKVRREDMESELQVSGRLTAEARFWLGSVDDLVHEAGELHESVVLREPGCLGFCKNYGLPRRVALLLEKIRSLMRRCDDLGVLVGGDTREHSSPVTGREMTLSEIHGYLKRDDVWIVGIYGMGGVGKTTLMRRILNDISAVAGAAYAHDVVFWVTVSRDPDVRKIQQQIGDGLGLTLPVDKGRAKILYAALSKSRYLLFLDDLWRALDLEAVGIPHPSLRRDSKILFSTRSEQVCDAMEAGVRVKLEPLDMESSRKLFGRIVGMHVDINDPPIQPLAEEIVARCGGQPLALATVGRSLATAQTIAEWQYVLSELSEPSSSNTFQSGKVLSILKFSFDMLESDLHKHCLLFFSLFPESHNINVEELIEYWVGEELLGGSNLYDDIDVVRNRGHSVVAALKGSCLLESAAGEDGDTYVHVHDLVHDMVLHVADDMGFLNPETMESKGSSGVYSWEEVVRISLMNSRMRDLPESPHSPNLFTLLLNRNTWLTNIPETFLNFMPVLRVLDLSSTRIEELPDTIGLLVELRYLNLSDTAVRSLPICIGKLVKLKQLDLGYTKELAAIPQSAILGLLELQKLNLYKSAYNWAAETDGHGERGVRLKDLESLKSLKDLRLDVKSLHILLEILSPNGLSRFIRYLTLQQMEISPHLQPAFNTMSMLRELCINECSGLQELKFSDDQLGSLRVLSLLYLPITEIVILGTALPSLRSLHILSCHQLKHLTPLHQLPCLECLDLRVCYGLEEVISAPVNEDSAIFPRLRKINLHVLPNLQLIYQHPLFFPCLEYLEVYGCPKFKKLPLDSYSARNIKGILGMQKWWDELQWYEERTKSRFNPIYEDPWQEEEEE